MKHPRLWSKRLHKLPLFHAGCKIFSVLVMVALS